MKKTIIVLASAAITLTTLQIACSKSEAQTPTTNTTTQVGKIVFKRNNAIWVCNYDGTSLTQINIVLPQGIGFTDGMNPVVSPNGQKIFFTAGTSWTSNPSPGDYYADLYSCNIDGSSVTKIVDRANGYIELGQAY